MRIGFKSNQWSDANGNPAGGCTTGTGFTISWQNGPLGRHAEGCNLSVPNGCVEGCTRREPNGAFVEDVIDACADRLRFYQRSKFACQENAEALAHLQKALEILDSRTRNREVRKVEGTHAT